MVQVKTLRWIVPGVLGIGAFYVGGQIEVVSVNSGAGFDHEHCALTPAAGAAASAGDGA